LTDASLESLSFSTAIFWSGFSMILENLVISFFATAITALVIFKLATLRPKAHKGELAHGYWGNYTKTEVSPQPAAES
jgi:hypothetical protein